MASVLLRSGDLLRGIAERRLSQCLQIRGTIAKHMHAVDEPQLYCGVKGQTRVCRRSFEFNMEG